MVKWQSTNAACSALRASSFRPRKNVAYHRRPSRLRLVHSENCESPIPSSAALAEIMPTKTVSLIGLNARVSGLPAHGPVPVRLNVLRDSEIESGMGSFPAQTEKLESATRSHIDFVRR